jgi:hypothetical protein
MNPRLVEKYMWIGPNLLANILLRCGFDRLSKHVFVLMSEVGWTRLDPIPPACRVCLE